MPQGVGQRLLRQPVDRRVDLEREFVQVIWHLHVYEAAGPVRGGRATPSRRAGLGGVLGRGSVASTRTIVRVSRQGGRMLPLR